MQQRDQFAGCGLSIMRGPTWSCATIIGLHKCNSVFGIRFSCLPRRETFWALHGSRCSKLFGGWQNPARRSLLATGHGHLVAGIARAPTCVQLRVCTSEQSLTTLPIQWLCWTKLPYLNDIHQVLHGLKEGHTGKLPVKARAAFGASESRWFHESPIPVPNAVNFPSARTTKRLPSC